MTMRSSNKNKCFMRAGRDEENCGVCDLNAVQHRPPLNSFLEEMEAQILKFSKYEKVRGFIGEYSPHSNTIYRGDHGGFASENSGWAFSYFSSANRYIPRVRRFEATHLAGTNNDPAANIWNIFPTRFAFGATGPAFAAQQAASWAHPLPFRMQSAPQIQPSGWCLDTENEMLDRYVKHSGTHVPPVHKSHQMPLERPALRSPVGLYCGMLMATTLVHRSLQNTSASYDCCTNSSGGATSRIGTQSNRCDAVTGGKTREGTKTSDGAQRKSHLREASAESCPALPTVKAEGFLGGAKEAMPSPSFLTRLQAAGQHTSAPTCK